MEGRPTLYVIIPPSPLFAAHWSFFIPNVSVFDSASKHFEEPNTGRRIHVSGSRLNGFTLEIIRDYDITKHRSARKFPIGTVTTNHSNLPSETHLHFVQKDEEEGGGYIDNRPLDELERVCVDVGAPGPSLNCVSGSVNDGGKRIKMEVRDCQWWVLQAVRAMVEREVISALPSENGDGRSPVDIVASLPKH